MQAVFLGLLIARTGTRFAKVVMEDTETGRSVTRYWNEIPQSERIARTGTRFARRAWDKKINGDLEADKVFKLHNGHAFVTDSKGRVTQVGGDINPERFDRNYYQQRLAGKVEADSGYEGGHLIGHQLGGAGDKINLVPMTTGLNRGAYLKMENSIAKAMLDPNVGSVSMKIDVGYPPTDTVTPNVINVQVIVDGVSTDYLFTQ